jgi:trk system potassium uptake protein
MIKFLLRLDIEKFLSFGYFSKIPQKQLFIGYLSYIALGSVLLCLPFAQKSYTGILDNLFIATSAITTTGLVTVSISQHYTFFGQFVILLLIQLGGIGYMTLSSFVILKVSHHLPKIKSEVLNHSFSIPEGFEIRKLVRGIVMFTFAFELTGAILLYFIFLFKGADQPVWSAIFHSISAFCTAGFGLYDDSFEQFRYNTALNAVLATLSYAGGIGFIVLTDLREKVKNVHYKITFTSKIILVVTLLLSTAGTFYIFLFEPSIQHLDDYSKFTISLFQSMTALTTVGFNTIPIGQMHITSLMVLIVLMYIGASPSGTGGGMKSTTFSAVVAYIDSRMRLKKEVTLFGHQIPDYRWQAAISTFIFYTSILFTGTMMLTFTEGSDLKALLFECTSALGTVGLSCGITSSLSAFGKMIIVALMFVGRIGVLTFGMVLLNRHQRNIIQDDLAT